MEMDKTQAPSRVRRSGRIPAPSSRDASGGYGNQENAGMAGGGVRAGHRNLGGSKLCPLRMDSSFVSIASSTSPVIGVSDSADGKSVSDQMGKVGGKEDDGDDDDAENTFMYGDPL